MNFLRKRLFVFYGMLLVVIGGVVGSDLASRFVPAKPARANDLQVVSISLNSGVIVLAHVLVIAFALYLHTRPRNAEVIGQRPRPWLVFTYGAYAIGIALGAMSAIVMR